MVGEMKPVFWNTQSNNVCAFCKKHCVWMTPKQMKKRNCIARHCDALSPLQDHGYWKNRAVRKEQRKNRKKRLEAQYMAIVSGTISYEI